MTLNATITIAPALLDNGSVEKDSSLKFIDALNACAKSQQLVCSTVKQNAHERDQKLLEFYGSAATMQKVSAKTNNSR